MTRFLRCCCCGGAIVVINTVAHIEAALVETPVEIVRSRASSGNRDRTKRLHRQHS
ncbi:hypothetical protein [Coleofasciculus sp. G2-EDA-02]|uniref:hypothetical protein n=1 Tax=Coleofasciculus sp. G2-EDA-02 TaxID=3069529 RepID=UPI0032FA5EE7